ncbi:regulatory protein repA [Caudoviricetes sp.]|nr:regulatory protein repA [Caudoviricetes sp.]
MPEILKILGDNWESNTHKLPYAEQLSLEMQKHGISPDEIIIDGEIHRFGDKLSGWYIAFPDTVPSGRFGDWRLDIDIGWRATPNRPLSPLEEQLAEQRKEEAQKARDIARAIKAEDVAKKCLEIFGHLKIADSHEYLITKNVPSYNCRINQHGQLTLPVFDESGNILSLQYIHKDGTKRFHPNSSPRGGFWYMGSDKSQVYIAEGYATAASIHEATGKMVFIAYSAYNLHTVAGIVRGKLGSTQKITVVADNDAIGASMKYANIAAEKYGCSVIKPPFGDANDYAQTHNLKELLEPSQAKEESWLTPALSLCSEFKPIKWLIKKVIPKESLIMVYGPSGAGKTFCVLDMAMSIASGRKDWFGLKVNQGNVVYLAGEGHAGLRQRVAAWNQTYQPKELGMFVSKGGCDLNTSTGLQKIVQSLDEIKTTPDLIIVDTLHRFLLGDENSAQDTKTLLDACSALTKHYRCSVMLVHHVGVADTAQLRPRGSSSWWGALDSAVCLVAAKEEGNIPMQMIQLKAKDDECVAPRSAGLQVVPINGWIDDDGDQVTSCILVPKTPPATTPNLAREVFEIAWDKAGREEVDGLPYISRSAFQAYIEKENRWNHTKAATEVKRLATVLKLTPKESGWVRERDG